MTPKIEIRSYAPDDWPTVKNIYAEGMATGLATFETNPSTQQHFEEDSISGSRFVAVTLAGEVVGWASLWPASDRCAYSGVAEVSVYVAAPARGHGVGGLLLQALITASEALDLWTLQAGILRENTASIRLHKRMGFREIGYRERIGQVAGRWHDTILMERRSHIVGL